MKIFVCISTFLSLILCGCTSSSDENMRTPVDDISLSKDQMHDLYLEAEKGNLRAVERLGDLAALEGRPREARLWQQISIDLGDPSKTEGLNNAFLMGAQELSDEVARRIFVEASTWDRKVKNIQHFATP